MSLFWTFKILTHDNKTAQSSPLHTNLACNHQGRKISSGDMYNTYRVYNKCRIAAECVSVFFFCNKNNIAGDFLMFQNNPKNRFFIGMHLSIT